MKNNVGAIAIIHIEAGSLPAIIANPFEQTERRFCRDCKHRVMNAFRIYCSLHDKDVGPMDDCPQYEKREQL